MSQTNNYRNHLQILEQEEIEQLYALPDFDLEDRLTFFTLSPPEHSLMQIYRGVSSQTFFILQLGYFKAKHLFFVFDFEQRAVDTAFVLKQYFPETRRKDLVTISRPTRYNQQQSICDFFEYRRFDEAGEQEVVQQAATLARRHNHAVYLFRSLLHYLHNRKIILPAYSFLQRHVISKVMQAEQRRLEKIIDAHMSSEEKSLVAALLEKPGDGMYPLTLLQKEPSSFDYYQIRRLLDRQKLLQPIYEIALRLCALMEIANENIRHYSTQATEYKVFNLKRMQGNMPYVYLLCFAHNRYRWANDILAAALKFYVSGIEKSADKDAQKQLYAHQLEANESLARVPKVLALFKDGKRDDVLFGKVKKVAFGILSPKGFDLAIDLIRRSKPDKKELVWMFYQINKRLVSLYPRPLCFYLSFNSNRKGDHLMEALGFIKDQVENKKKRLTQIPTQELPCGFLSKKRKKYVADREGNIQLPRYITERYDI